MKQPLLIVILAALTYFYFHNSPAPDSKTAAIDPAPAHANPVVNREVIVASAPPSYERWKIGPTAQNNWKTGPNAQTEFAPFAPSEHANWNQTPGCTIVAGPRIPSSSRRARR